jgi:hypothetical protein
MSYSDLFTNGLPFGKRRGFLGGGGWKDYVIGGLDGAWIQT